MKDVLATCSVSSSSVPPVVFDQKLANCLFISEGIYLHFIKVEMVEHLLDKELSVCLYDPAVTVVNGGTQWQGNLLVPRGTHF